MSITYLIDPIVRETKVSLILISILLPKLPVVWLYQPASIIGVAFFQHLKIDTIVLGSRDHYGLSPLDRSGLEQDTPGESIEVPKRSRPCLRDVREACEVGSAYANW